MPANAGLGAGEQRREARVLAAVVGDLEDLDGRQLERAGDVRLGVGGEEDVEAPDARDRHDRAVVGVALGAPAGRRAGRPEEPEADAAQLELLVLMRGHHVRAQPALGRRVPAGAPVEDQPRVVLAGDRHRHPLVVELGVGEDEGVEAPYAGLSQAGEDRPAGRPGVEEDRRAAVLQQRRVALADVEEGDDEVAGLGRAGRAEGGDDDHRRSPGRPASAAVTRIERGWGPRGAVHRHARPASAISGRQGGVGRRPASPGRRGARGARPRAAARRRAPPTRRRRAAAR